MTIRFLIAGFAINLFGIYSSFALDSNLPPYQTAPGITGHIKAVGSDTLDKEMIGWAKGFMALYPDVKIEIEGKGSATAPPALTEGISRLGPMSRGMSSDEIAAFEKKYGYRASNFRVAVDALAVYVNKANLVECLTLQQVNRIFSTSRVAAFGGDIKTWGEVGLGGEWANKPISLFGRNSISGTFEFFRETALIGGEYKPEVRQQPGSEAVIQAVSADRLAIGYSGIGYKAEGVRSVPLSLHSGATCYDTSAEATYAGKYPLARYLYVYLNKNPNQPLDPTMAEFIKFVLSKDGQTLTELGGFFSITNADRETDLKKLGIVHVAN